MSLTSGVKKLLIIIGILFFAVNLAEIVKLDSLPFDLTYNNFSFTKGIGGFNPIQLVTYPFLHLGGSSIFQTIIILISFGSLIEMAFGENKLFQLFFFSAIGAALMSNCIGMLLLDLGKISEEHFFTFTLSGANAAMMGILGAYVTFAPDREFNLLFIPIGIKAKYLIGLYVVMNFVNNIRTVGNFEFYASISGFCIGIILMRTWRRSGLGKW